MSDGIFIPSWKDTPLKKNPRIPLLVKQRADLAAKIKALEETRREISETLEAALVKSELDAVTFEGFTTLRVTTTKRSKVDDGKIKQALLEVHKLPLKTVVKLWEDSTTFSTSSFLTGGAPSERS